MTPPEDPAWRRIEPSLPTPWSADVAPGNALPEYPRPQLTRPRWLNLNGVWKYAGWPSSPDEPRPSGYAERILVPFPPESALSGIRRRDEVLWYRRLFEVPADWRGSRLLLHFGAVDQTAKVWVNNQLVATHEGGYTAFSADITDVLRASGPQELTVRAEDRTDIEPFPVGKQRNAPGGICYTPSSGIWQTVWLEPVPENRIERLDLTPDLTGVTVFPQVTGGADVVVVISAKGIEVARAAGPAGTAVRVDVPSPRLWTPDDPHLYSLRVQLLDECGAISDEVGSYTGLRTIGLVPDRKGARGSRSTAVSLFCTDRSTRATGRTASRPRPPTTPCGPTSRRRRSSASTSSANTSRSSRPAGTTGPTRWAWSFGRTCRR